MSEIEQLVSRTVQMVSTISRTATRFANRLVIGVVVICVGGFLLGIAALSGGFERVWIALGVVFGAIAIGGVVLARWRVGAVQRHVPELAREVRALLDQGVGSTRTVIESFAVDDDGDGRADVLDDRAGSAISMTRQMHGFRGLVGSGLESSARLTAAVTALTTFPLLVLSAIAITVVFGFLGLIFLVALAL